MHAAVARAVGLVLETNFPDRAGLLFERGDDVLLAEAIRHQPEHWVFRLHRRALSGIGDEKSARATQRRLGVAKEALVSIVMRTKPIGVGVELREYRIKFAHAHDRRTVRHIRAGIAG